MSEDLKNEILQIDLEIKSLQDKQALLGAKIKVLQSKKATLQEKHDLEKLKSAKKFDKWIIEKFSWDEKVKTTLKEVFKLDKFRTKQLAAINATLNKKDVLLLMPTGGGKSLVYQLPTFLENGLTVVVSPLVSLIEDQLIALNKLNIKAESLNGGTSKEDKKRIQTWMLDKKYGLKLLYVTPEGLAKKTFMSYLQKCYNAKNLNRIAIDEVHCCSTWGHDFRKDYNYLSLLKPMFPDIPFLGLTATASMNVLMDVQKMLGIDDCVVITAPFNRPNLFYKVINKPSEKSSGIDILENLLKNKYKDQSGIIYATTIKDTEDLTKALREKGLSVGYYHAQLENDYKKKMHAKWLENKYQVIIATIAFGMGIDKPDVRFVIHYSVPKSMEGLYQESGRAGRDGKKADCLLMFSISDYFRVLGMANSKVEEQNASSVLTYCLNKTKCRRSIIALYFDEVWDSSNCSKMCDFCKAEDSLISYDVSSYYRDLCKIIRSASEHDAKLTVLKLVNAWFRSSTKEFPLPDFKKPGISRSDAEYIIAYFLSENYFKLEKGYNLYSVIFYIKENNVNNDKIDLIVPKSFHLNGLLKRDYDSVDSEISCKKQKC